MSRDDEFAVPPRPVRAFAVGRWSRTAIVGFAGVTVLGAVAVVALLTGHADGATLGACVAGITGCVGAVAGRPGAPGRDP